MLNLDQLKKDVQERPIEGLVGLAAVALAASKVIDTLASARSKNAYAKQVKRSTSRKK